LPYDLHSVRTLLRSFHEERTEQAKLMVVDLATTP